MSISASAGKRRTSRCSVVAAAALLFLVPDQAKSLSEIRRVLRHLHAATAGAANLRELAALSSDV
jgi:hypothetical protein